MGDLPILPFSVVRGSNNTFNVSLRDPDGNVYVLAVGEVLRFGVKRYYEDPTYCIEKTLTAADYKNGVYPIILNPEDTEALSVGKYEYDIGIQSDNQYWPVIAVSPFTITKNITSREVVSGG